MATARQLRKKFAKQAQQQTLHEALVGAQQLRQSLAIAHMVIKGLVGEPTLELLELVDSVIKGEANLAHNRKETLSMEKVGELVAETIRDFKIVLAEQELVPQVTVGPEVQS